MTGATLGTLAAALVALPLAAGGAAPSQQGVRLAQSGGVPEKCARIKDPKERAACIRAESSGGKK